MGLLDFLLKPAKAIPESQAQEVSDGSPRPIKTIEVGTAGTEIYGGYISEDYLHELQGKQWQDTIDRMFRSDTNVKMVVSALVLPLKSSNWRFAEIDDSPEAEMQKKILEKAFFEDTDKSFTMLLGEILSMVRCGYSLFDITHQVKNDKELGTYNTLKSISFRSQRTIERWNIEHSGKLITVTQMSNGDEGENVNMDATYLLHFAPEQEGDNYEGIGVLRAIYGPWLRKDKFLKLLAAGIEKYAIPTPVLTVPPGKEGSPEYKSAEKMLKCYGSGQANYIILPDGWKLEFNNVTFDSEKIRAAINAENQEMVNSILASFLLLGQNGAGSLALSSELSDFFKQTITYLADHITEVLTKRIMKPLIQMNLGDVPLLVELRCDGLEEKADGAWATTLKTLKDAGLIKSENEVLKYVAEKLKLPVSDAYYDEKPQEVAPIQEPKATETPTEPVPPAPKKALSEKPKKKVNKTPDLIREQADLLRSVGKVYLPEFASELSRRIAREAKSLPESQRMKAPLNVNEPSLNGYYKAAYVSNLISAVLADQIVEPDFKRNKKLSEFRLATTKTKRVEDVIASFKKGIESEDTMVIDSAAAKAQKVLEDYVTTTQANTIQARSDIYVDVQRNDISKSTNLAYQNLLSSTDLNDIEFELNRSALETINGPMLTAGPDVQASQAVNDGLQDAADKYEKETGNEIVSFTYIAIDDDVTTECCRQLNGHTFAADDPEMKKYTPPLHFNCRSYMAVNTSAMKDNPEIDGPVRLTKTAQDQITL